jgi:mxaJ protein
MRYFILISFFCATITLSFAETVPQTQPSESQITVCADPADLPFSNKELEGFENKIAKIVAEGLNLELNFYWWPNQRGLVRNTLDKNTCQVLIGVPTDYELVLTTKPYYRTTYVLTYRLDEKLDIKSLDDPILKKLRIGMHVNAPPAEILAQNGLMDNVVGYSSFYDPESHPEDYPGKIVEDLLSGKLDVVVVWGPVAGYFVAKKNAPLRIVPIESSNPVIPTAFNFSMGVRKGDKDLKEKLERILDERKSQIRKVLEDYGVPLLEITQSPTVDSKATVKGHKHPED